MIDTNHTGEESQTYTYSHPRPMVTVDAVVWGINEQCLEVVLVERRYEPFAGTWALPGGFVEMDETLDAAVARELEEETGLSGVRLEQCGVFGDPGRDPRGRTVSIVYLALVDHARHRPRGGDDAAQAAWFPIHALPPLAFDHHAIVMHALTMLRNRTRYGGVGGQLLPPEFSVDELRGVYETILGVALNPGMFQREMVDLGVLDPAAAIDDQGRRLYRFNPARLARF